MAIDREQAGVELALGRDPGPRAVAAERLGDRRDHAELAATVLDSLKEKVSPGRGASWGELGKSPDSMTLYEGLLLVSAPPAAHRAITAALQDLYR